MTSVLDGDPRARPVLGHRRAHHRHAAGRPRRRRRQGRAAGRRPLPGHCRLRRLAAGPPQRRAQPEGDRGPATGSSCLVDDADVVLEAFCAGHDGPPPARCRYAAGPQPAAGRLLDHGLRAARRHIATGRATRRSSPPGSASSTSSAATTVVPSPTCTVRSRSSLTWRSPKAWSPGSPRPGPIFTYTPWLSMGTAFLATTGINAALFARERTGRGQHVETSLLQAALTETAVEVAAGRKTRRARLPVVGLRPAGTEGVLQVRRRSMGPAMGATPPLRAQ